VNETFEIISLFHEVYCVLQTAHNKASENSEINIVRFSFGLYETGLNCCGHFNAVHKENN